MPERLLPVLRHCELQIELGVLMRTDPGEATAVENALHKLEAEGPMLPFPWSSAVRSPPLKGLRELRPRAGHSRVRILYVRHGERFIMLALAPEAEGDPRRFRRAAQLAAKRFHATTLD